MYFFYLTWSLLMFILLACTFSILPFTSHLTLNTIRPSGRFRLLVDNLRLPADRFLLFYFRYLILRYKILTFYIFWLFWSDADVARLIWHHLMHWLMLFDINLRNISCWYIFRNFHLGNFALSFSSYLLLLICSHIVVVAKASKLFHEIIILHYVRDVFYS